MRITLAPSGALERDIRPPMQSAITIPVLIDGEDVGVVVYVARTPFLSSANLSRELPPSVLVAKVAAVLEKVMRKGETIF